MRTEGADAGAPRRGRRTGRRTLTVVAFTASVIGGALLGTAGTAHADVTTGGYAVVGSAGSAGSVVASPASVRESASTDFVVTFTTGAALSAAADAFVVVQPTEALASVPAHVYLVGGSCLQTGTAGTGGAGTSGTEGLTIELAGSCTITAGGPVQVYFTADAPSSVGSFYFSVTISGNSTLTASNLVTVGTSGGALAGASYAYGASTAYTISGIAVGPLTSGNNTVVLTAVSVAGTEALSFYNGPSGYTVSYTPSAGSATSDPVGAAATSGNSVALTLIGPLAAGGTLNITALGTNPVASTSSQTNAIDVQAGNAPPELTSTITFGTSVSEVTVSPSVTAAGAATTYTVGFRAATAVGVGGQIGLNETAGPTNFSTVTGVEVHDTTKGWSYAGAPATLADGTATITANDAINAGDLMTITLANVTNPPTGAISDFGVWTTADQAPAEAAPYTIGASTSSGVTVTLNPPTAGYAAIYAISDLRASAAMTAGASTITIEGPAGTVFPTTPGFYYIQDSTTAAGSGVVATIVNGGGTNDVVIAVPSNISSGDMVTLEIENIFNPTMASSAYAITLLGNVTGLGTAATSVPPASQPRLTALTAAATVSGRAVRLELRCAQAKCTGAVTLMDVRTELGHAKYDLAAGKIGYVTVGLFQQALSLLAGAKDHTLELTETATVNGGERVTKRVTVTTNSPPLRPVVAPPYTRLTVSNKSVTLELRCSHAACAGAVSLVDVRTTLGKAQYHLGAGQTGRVQVGLVQPALALLAGAKDHAINATEKVTVDGGKTVAITVTLVGPALG